MASKALKQSVEQMRKIFDLSQRVDKHNECLKQLIRLQTIYSKTNQSVKWFYEELVRNIKFALWVPEPRSPHTHHTITFVIKYLLAFCANSEDLNHCPPNEDNDERRHEFIDSVLEDVVIPLTRSVKPECRINASHFIRLLSDELSDISEDIHKKIRRALLERSADRKSEVRAAAVLALHRFQDATNPNDLVLQAIQFHLNYDPDHEVRHNCLKSMAICDDSRQYFIDATRDIKDFIRKTAYIQISNKLQIKCFTIEQRLTILKNGLKDRSPVVRKVVEQVLIPTWVKSCDNDLIKLLIALDIQTDIDLIEKMLEIYFKQLNREKVFEDVDSITKFQQLIDEFCELNLTKDRLFKVTLNIENVFLWRFLCEFCKTNQIQRQNKLKTTEATNEQNISEEVVEEEQQNAQQMPLEVEVEEEVLNQSTTTPDSDAETLFESLVPDVSYFCVYLEKYIRNLLSEELSIADALDFEFIYLQFMKVSLLLEIGDEAQRKSLIKTMRSILIDNQIGDKFHNYITPLMKCLAKNGFTDNDLYLDFTVEIIGEIVASIATTCDENDSITDDSNRELEEKTENLIEVLNKCKTELQELESEGKQTEAQDMTKKISDLELEVMAIKEKISNNNTLSQSSQTSQPKSLPVLSDHPKHLVRCLHILSGCLEFGDFNKVNAVLQTHIEKVCLLGFLSEDVKLRIVATRCLGLVCLISPQYFKKYLNLLIEVFLKDLESIKLVALQSIFDSLCEHGINIFEEKADKSGDELNETKLGFEESDEDFITSLKQFFDTQMDSDLFEIKQTAVQGVAKLLIHCRMYSPELLAKLILIWFTPDQNQLLIQFIGDFLRLYAIAESQGVIVGQSALEDAFVITLQTIYENNLKNINSENLIKFFLNMICDESHPKLCAQLVKRVMDCEPTERKLAEEYLSAISQLNLIEMSTKELKSFEKSFQTIRTQFEQNCNFKSKAILKKLNLIEKKIENRSQQMSADLAFELDFEPIDDKTNCDDKSQNDDSCDENIVEPKHSSDSEADSFRTCPESPVQKRRRLPENDLSNETNESEICFREANPSVNIVSMEEDSQPTSTVRDGIELQTITDLLIEDPFMEMD